MNDDIEDVTGSEPRSVTVGATKVVVNEVTMGTLQAFTRACAPFLSEFDEAGKLAYRFDDEGNPIPLEDFALFKVLSEHAPSFMDAAALVTNMPRSWYDRLPPDKFFEVAALVVEVNGNFFVRSLAPQLIKFARGISSIGSMLSNISSITATATQTS